MILHSIDAKNLEILEGIFAYLTKDGWIIPDWIELLRKEIK